MPTYEITLSKKFEVFTTSSQVSAISMAREEFKKIYNENAIQEMDYHVRTLPTNFPESGRFTFRK